LVLQGINTTVSREMDTEGENGSNQGIVTNTLGLKPAQPLSPGDSNNCQNTWMSPSSDATNTSDLLIFSPLI
jgi:hypothetical protein